MKIKVLIFPLFLGLSVCILIFYAKPEFDSYLSGKKEIAGQKEKLQEIQSQKAKIASLAEILDRNREKEKFIEAFLPANREEEDVINALNYIAGGSGVAIIGLSLAENKQSIVESQRKAIIAAEDNTSTSKSNSSDSQIAQPFNLEFKVSVLGKYENIRSFLDQIHKIEMFSSLNTVMISKMEENQIGNRQSLMGEALQSEKQNLTNEPGMFIAAIEMDFGYLPGPEDDRNALSGIQVSESKLDFAVYDKLAAFIVKKIPALEVQSEGRVNPFLP